MGKFRVELTRTERIYVDVMAGDIESAKGVVEQWLYEDETPYDMLSNTDHVSGPTVTAIEENVSNPYPSNEDIKVAEGIYAPKYL